MAGIPGPAGGPSKADVASAVHEAAAELASGVRPGRQCLIYSVAGAMVSTEAFGGRFVLQVGGYQFENVPGVMAVHGPAWAGRAVRDELDLHCWFTEVPPGVDPEDSWGSPPWLKVIDLWLRHLGPVNARKGIYVRSLPDFVWGPVDRVREVSGVGFRPDRGSAIRFLGMVTEGPDSDYWMRHLRVADEVACLAARKLGLPRLRITADAVVPSSFMCPLGLADHDCRPMAKAG